MVEPSKQPLSPGAPPLEEILPSVVVHARRGRAVTGLAVLPAGPAGAERVHVVDRA